MAVNNTTETVTQGDTVIAGARVPTELWQSIKRAAVDKKTTAQEITTEALREWLSRNAA